jgi:hypothetical protein
LNPGPHPPQGCALPDCATSRRNIPEWNIAYYKGTTPILARESWKKTCESMRSRRPIRFTRYSNTAGAFPQSGGTAIPRAVVCLPYRPGNQRAGSRILPRHGRDLHKQNASRPIGLAREAFFHDRSRWSECRDLNPGPHPPQGCALPGCATSRLYICTIQHFNQGVNTFLSLFSFQVMQVMYV